MDRQTKDAICKLIDTELDKISKMPTLNDVTLNNLHLLIVSKEKLLRTEEIENKMNGMYENSYRGYSYDHERIMPPIYDRGYSRSDAYSHLEAAMRDARNDQEREEIRQLMTRYHN